MELVCVCDGGVVAVSARGAVVGWPSFHQGTAGACHGRAAIQSEDRVRSTAVLQPVSGGVTLWGWSGSEGCGVTMRGVE